MPATKEQGSCQLTQQLQPQHSAVRRPTKGHLLTPLPVMLLQTKQTGKFMSEMDQIKTQEGSSVWGQN